MNIEGTVTDLRRLKNTDNGYPMWSFALTGIASYPWIHRVKTEPNSQCSYLISPNWEGQKVRVHMRSVTLFDDIELID